MNISVIVRIHNEERNLEKFVKAYHDWVDHIFIQDDNSDSEDYIWNVIDEYPKTKLDFYDDKRIVTSNKNVTRAYHHIQLNQLIDSAKQVESDWIILDDCDSVPNKHLREGGRQIIEACPLDFVYVTRITFYKDLGYFPEFSTPKGSTGHCLWAWRANKGFRFIDNGCNAQRFDRIDSKRIYKLNPPYVLLHYPWPSDEVILQKRERYTAIYGEEYSRFDPLMFAGKLDKKIPWYAEE
jgi:glycosyltransferase involved in cell wall biosynthesis